MPAELAPPVDFLDAVLVVAAGFLCLTAPPPARGATLFPGLFVAPTVVELAGAGISVRL